MRQYRVTLRNRGDATVPVDGDEPILDALETTSLVLTFGCRYGGCVTCAARMLSGSVRQPRGRALNKRQSRLGYVLLRVARPQTDCVPDVGVESHDELYVNPFAARQRVPYSTGWHENSRGCGPQTVRPVEVTVMQSQQHWERIYASKPVDGVSWFQQHAEQSLRMIRDTGVPLSAAIIDVGGGASTLVDDLADMGYSNLTVLDLADSALTRAQTRLGEKARRIGWIEGDITRVDLRPEAYDVWHDRAVFHFLIDRADRQAYIAQILRAVKPGGHIIIATFAEDGPQKCSGLPVTRYSPEALHTELGERFDPVEYQRETHLTPFGTGQRFIYCRYRKLPG